MSATATDGAEGGLIAVNIAASGYDADDNVSLTITGVPAGATLTDALGVAYAVNGDGSYTLTTGQLTGLHLNATNLEQGNLPLHMPATNTSKGGTTATDVTVTVDPVPDAPPFSFSRTRRPPRSTLFPNTALFGSDADDNVSLTITGVPAGATLTDALGVAYAVNGDGSYTLTTGQLTGLHLDATNLERSESVVYGKSADLGGRRIINNNNTVTVDPVAES